MKWKFWKKDEFENQETTIKVTNTVGSVSTEISVSAQTPDKTLELYKKLEKSA